MVKQLFSSAVAALLLTGTSAAYAVAPPLTTFSTTEYTVIYDASALGTIQSWNNQFFAWKTPNSINVTDSQASFALPSFTLTPNAGYTLSERIDGFFGNLSFTAVGGGIVAGDISGNVSIDGGAAFPLLVNLGISTTSSFGGYLSANPSYNTGTGTIASIDFSAGLLNLTATNNGGFAGIAAQPQNEFSISFVAAPVPEPESYAMLVAGLCLIGAITRRRTRRA